MQAEFSEFDANRTPAEEVARVVEKALLAPRPSRRYQVGHLSRAAALAELLPQGWQDAVLARR